MPRQLFACLVTLHLGALIAAGAENSPTSLFQPDPKSVQRSGPAYRYPQAGWIVLHVEGEPYERGYQHGQLLAPEIADFVRCCANLQSPKAPTEGWRHTRSLANALFVRRYQREYLEEMKGIADGASAAGARFDSRPIDLVDIVCVNSWPEIETLDSALEATPTGLEGIRFPHQQPRAKPLPKPMHCSAFAATGPATADGKIVFGHITMFGLYPARYYNVWLDVKPAKGHRVLMQSYPGGIQSGMDYYYNDAGLIVCETTIGQTKFDIKGLTVANRIRQALQYADSIDRAVEILKASNNGLYTNEWLLADIKTNEIAMFELGTAASKLYRSSKNEWFGGTPGFYWGCNNTKDLHVRLETLASTDARPANVVFRPSDRDKKWLDLFEKHKGKIGVAFGMEAFTTPPVAAYPSLDAKFTTTDLARELKTWALFGPPLGRTWQPTQEERLRFSDIQPLVSNPWTILHTLPPPAAVSGYPVVDLPRLDGSDQEPKAHADERTPPTKVAWHGTLLPKTDVDVWLAAAFADYERVVALDKALQENEKDQPHSKDARTSPGRERLGLELFRLRSSYLAAARVGADVPLSQTKSSLAQSEWYQIAAGKGGLLLHELCRRLGQSQFVDLMESFGRQNAGKQVTAAAFREHVERAAGKRLNGFFDYWLQQPGLPSLRLGNVQVAPSGATPEDEHPKHWQVKGEVFRDGPGPHTVVDVTAEHAEGEVTRSIELEAGKAEFTLQTPSQPKRVILDKYGLTSRANGGAFAITSFHAELARSLIVYGTRDEVPSNREAADGLQRTIIQRGSNITVPIKTDKEVTDEDLQSHHVLLIGRPDTNAVVERFRNAFPVKFGHRSFTVRFEDYAHPDSALVAAAPNPMNLRFSMVVLAGLSAESTWHTPSRLLARGARSVEVVVLPHKGRPHAMMIPPPEFVRAVELPKSAAAGQ